MGQELSEMSVEQLEALSYELTAQRQFLRKQALAVQTELGKKIEARHVSKILGREVQIVEVPAIEGAEALGVASTGLG
jgi:hypothetical protein